MPLPLGRGRNTPSRLEQEVPPYQFRPEKVLLKGALVTEEMRKKWKFGLRPCVVMIAFRS